ncbi:MAG: bifunctional oligoribonuclease/PAP phosphatase NrnA [Bacteroidota bacterium]
MKNLPAFQALIASPRKVIIVTHFKPDADALGSSLGLAGFLRKKGHQVTVITPSDYPAFLTWMPGNEGVISLSTETEEPAIKAKAAIEAAEVLFCLDFSSLSRINSLGENIKNAAGVKVMIDHHLEPEKFASFEQWDPLAASTAGLVFQLIEQLGEKDLIDADIANCLYAGIMTDTGGFRHSNTTQTEFLIASELTGRGANPSDVAKQVYDTNSFERLKLTGFVLSQKLHVLPQFNTAYIMLTSQELKQFGSQTGDTEGLVNWGLSIKGIKLSVLMYDRKEEIKLSFRSLGSFSVNEMARKYFEGGGHRNASGGTSRLSLEATLQKFLSILPEYESQLKSSN